MKMVFALYNGEWLTAGKTAFTNTLRNHYAAKPWEN
jgi:hypothetical protein